MKRGANVHSKKFLFSAGAGYLIIFVLIAGFLKAGIAIALPVAFPVEYIGGFIIEANKILLKNLEIKPSTNDSSWRGAFRPGNDAAVGDPANNVPMHGNNSGAFGFDCPQMYLVLDASIYGLKLWKQLELSPNWFLELRVTTPSSNVLKGGDGGYDFGGDGGADPPMVANFNDYALNGNELQIYATRIYANAVFSGLLIDEVYTLSYSEKFVLRAVSGKLEQVYINAHQMFAPMLTLDGLRLGVSAYSKRDVAAAELSPGGNYDWLSGGSYQNI